MPTGSTSTSAPAPGTRLSALLDAAPTRAGIALDISKHAAKVAAHAHERIGSIVADVWTRLPLRDGCAVLVLDIFSPRNAEEFARVLIDGGTLIVVTPNPEHLAELVGPLELITIDPRKRERLSVKLGSHFEQVAEQIVTYPLTLSHADATRGGRDGAERRTRLGRGARAAGRSARRPHRGHRLGHGGHVPCAHSRGPRRRNARRNPQREFVVLPCHARRACSAATRRLNT